MQNSSFSRGVRNVNGCACVCVRVLICEAGCCWEILLVSGVVEEIVGRLAACTVRAQRLGRGTCCDGRRTCLWGDVSSETAGRA